MKLELPLSGSRSTAQTSDSDRTFRAFHVIDSSLSPKEWKALGEVPVIDDSKSKEILENAFAYGLFPERWLGELSAWRMSFHGPELHPHCNIRCSPKRHDAQCRRAGSMTYRLPEITRSNHDPYGSTLWPLLVNPDVAIAIEQTLLGKEIVWASEYSPRVDMASIHTTPWGVDVIETPYNIAVVYMKFHVIRSSPPQWASQEESL